MVAYIDLYISGFNDTSNVADKRVPRSSVNLLHSDGRTQFRLSTPQVLNGEFATEDNVSDIMILIMQCFCFFILFSSYKLLFVEVFSHLFT